MNVGDNNRGIAPAVRGGGGVVRGAAVPLGRKRMRWEPAAGGGKVNVTPTEPGYCPFYDEFGCHAYMGGRSHGRSDWEYREDWTTCCDLDTPGRTRVPQ